MKFPKLLVAMMVAGLGLGATGSSKEVDPTIRKAMKMSRDRVDIESLIRQFEDFHGRSDFPKIKELLCARLQESYDPEIVSGDAARHAPLLPKEDGTEKYEIIGPIQTNQLHEQYLDAIIRLKLGGETGGTRTYFLLKENGGWKIEWVMPGKLDPFFLRFMSGQCAGAR